MRVCPAYAHAVKASDELAMIKRTGNKQAEAVKLKRVCQNCPHRRFCGTPIISSYSPYIPGSFMVVRILGSCFCPQLTLTKPGKKKG